MKLVCLSEIVEFSSGKNSARIKGDKYTPEDFDNDLMCRNTIISSEDCIINLIKTKASPISIENENKILTQNFLRCSLKKDEILPWFFCYQFNESKYLEKQIAMFNQGTTLSVKKLNVGTIQKLKIKLLDIEKQEIIGELYRKSMLQNELLIRQAENIKKCTLEIIKKIEED